ncbi:conserved hypothetical protein [Acidithiobacillus ferrivorans]|uniref:Uncharacterized protein n=1 Tax=Acidithiobacillus ferrivorans TaxID=160808 RepID=A0A060UN60_9PROT|nr:conserved hypothetical protein [Acidithiobacillus ferrivorans]
MLAFSVSYWMPNNYVRLFVALSVGQAIGALLYILGTPPNPRDGTAKPLTFRCAVHI